LTCQFDGSSVVLPAIFSFTEDRVTRFWKIVVSAIALSVAGVAFSQDAYPSRPIRFIIGFAPGSTADVAARIIAPKLSDVIGKPVIVENRPGAGGMLSTDYVAHAAPDGYTILFGTVAATINATLSPSQTVDFAKDLEPITSLASIPNVLVINPTVTASDVKSLIAFAKANPDALFYGSAGIGSSPHLTGELFDQMAGIQMTPVQYSGSAQAVTDLISGRVQVMFSPASTVMSFVKQGTLKALATTESKRAAIAPDLPTVSESGLAGFDTGIWFGLFAPRGTPVDVVDKISTAANTTLRDPQIIQLLETQGMETLGGTPQLFRQFVASELARWANVIKTANIPVQR
jgi:tripartite-type tricarboxylate transporter receptor subunit TctC